MTTIFYFGTWGDVGHYLWTPTRGMVGRAGPWTSSDLDSRSYTTRYYGGPVLATGRGFVPVDAEETQGIWKLTRGVHLFEPWTALGCYDRTQDPRGGSISVFVAKGEHDEPAMQALAAEHFPVVWARIHGKSS